MITIVKQFEDPVFLRLMYSWVSEKDLENDHFYWGLSDGGELYLKCTRFSGTYPWHKSCDVSDVGRNMSLKLMKRIVKEFGHLVIFT